MRRGVRVVSIILTGLVGLSLISTQAASAPRVQTTQPDWATLPYFRHDYGAWFRIWTNEEKFNPGVRVINGSSAGSMFSPYPGPTVEELEPTNEFQTLWAAKCQPEDEQVFKTTRKIYLPGKADKLQVELGAYSYHVKNKPSPVNRVELLINGIGVHEVKSSPGNPIPFDVASRTIEDVTNDAHLKFGLNTFTLIAHKKETKKAAGWCTGDNKFGVSAEVYGEFLADIEVSRTVGQGQQVTKAFKHDVTVTNLGPSVLIPNIVSGVGTFGASAVTSGVVLQAFAVVPVDSCNPPNPINTYRGVGLAISCQLPVMQPGASITYQVLGGYATELTPTTIYRVYGGAGAVGYGESTAEEQANNGVEYTLPTPSPSPAG